MSSSPPATRPDRLGTRTGSNVPARSRGPAAAPARPPSVLPVALGACFARPGERVYLVTADGELMMGLAEFDTAIRYRLPLTVIVLNDQAFGQERHNLAGKGLPLTYAEHPAPDLAALAAAFGARGYRVGNAEQLDVLGKALTEADGTVLIDVAVNREYLNPVSRDIASHLG